MNRAVLPDYLAPNLVAVVVGTAVGSVSASRGHYYAGPGNEFWSLLAASGLTAEFLGPERDREIVAHGLGLTDLAKDRAASSDASLGEADYDVKGFVRKMETYQPGWIAFHGKTAASEYLRAATGRRRSVLLGRQDWLVAGGPVYVLPSASGSNRDPSRLEGKPPRLAWFKDFKRVAMATTRDAR